MKSFIPRCTWAAMALFAATTVLTGLTSCAEKDLPAVVTPESLIQQDLVGSWIAEYSQKGMVTVAAGRQRYGINAVQTLTFNADGTGTCKKFICDAGGEAFSCFGGTGNPANGRFHYTVGKDSVITITRDGDGDASNPKTWKLTFGANGLKGTDGTSDYEMVSVTEGWKNYIARLEGEYLKRYRSGFQANMTDTTFLTHWEDYDTIDICGLKDIGPQYLPWAGTSNNDIPDEIRFDIQKAAGWEMAFCVLNDNNATDTRFFGLYNRFTGTLRVFHYVYQPGHQNYGKEVGYTFMADGNETRPRYPFYNSMEYAIPVCHNYDNNITFNRKATVISPTNIEHRAFESMYTAFTRATKPQSTMAGWHCVDYDMSGYVPEGVNWTQGQGINSQENILSITPYSTQEDQILLTGSIVGDIKGDFHEPQYMNHTSGSATLSKVAKTASALSGGVGGIISAVSSSYTFMNVSHHINDGIAGPQAQLNEQGEVIGMGPDNRFKVLSSGWCRALYGISGGLTGVSAVLNIADIWAGEHVDSVTEKKPGSINLNLDARVDLSGTISRWNSVSDAGVRITPALLQETKNYTKTQWFGSGCIGLAEDPVIYVSEEDLLSTSQIIKITKNGNNIIAPSFYKDSVRLVSFLDPRTVKVCINKDIYHNIDSVQLIINYGVNINRPVGNTDDYRRMLMLDERPTFSIMPKSGNQLTIATIPKLTVMKKASVIKNDFYTQLFPDSVKYDYQGGIPMYGHYDREFGKQFVTDPQVFIPFDPTENSYIVYPVTMPDFVVSVSIVFKCDECPQGVGFTQVYIPKIELIKHADLARFYDELKAYSDKSWNQQPVGTLYNDTNVKVYHDLGYGMLKKTLNVLEACIE